MLEINSIFENQYRILRVIGRGGMGTVYLAEDTEDRSRWAVKEEWITEENRALLTSEAELMERLSHPAFPRLRYKTQRDGFLYLVMEYINGRTLEDCIKERGRIGEAVVRDWFIQICSALLYLHGLEPPVVYRDLKPSNIMLEPTGQIRIIDFGIAQEYRRGGSQVDVAALTRGYAAPEQYDSRYYLDMRTDIYALAVTIHYLLTGKDPNKPPYHFSSVRKLRRDASYGMDYIVKKCLQPNPDKRYRDASRLLADLENLDAIDRDLRSRAKWKRILAASLTSGVLILSALAYFVSLQSRQAEMEAYYAYMEAADQASTAEKAAEALSQAIQMAPDNPEAYIRTAEVYLKYQDPERAADYIREEILPHFPDIYENAEFLVLIQQIEELGGN